VANIAKNVMQTSRCERLKRPGTTSRSSLGSLRPFLVYSLIQTLLAFVATAGLGWTCYDYLQCYPCYLSSDWAMVGFDKVRYN